MNTTLKTLKTEVLTRLERLSRAGFMTAKLLTAVTVLSSAAFPGTIFTSTFSDPNNVGEIGGGILSGSASDVAINQGPWDGTYHGIATLLAAPELTVSTTGGFSGGSGTISGIVGVNLLGLGLTNNYGWFFQQTSLTYNANTLYTLTADISTGGVINPLSLLSNDGVGISLTNNGDNVTAASTDPGAILSLIALSGNFYQATLQFQTGATAPTGDIGIRLFDEPTGLLTANLLSAVTFSNVNLGATATPEPATMALSGLGLVLVGLLKRKVTR